LVASTHEGIMTTAVDFCDPDTSEARRLIGSSAGLRSTALTAASL
jgi:hypothetical protein